MKKLLLALVLLVVSSTGKTLDAQTGWVRQSNPLGDSTDLGKIHFVSSTEGWISASKGRLLHTTDAGATWNTVVPFPNDTLNSSADPAIIMSWVNQAHGWRMNWFGTGLGDAHGAVIHKTTDGGNTWQKKTLIDSTTNVSYSTADFQGTWQMHGLVSPDHGPSDHTGWTGWMHGTMIYDASGNGTGSAIGSDGATRSNSGSMSISSNGVITVSGTNTYGFMSADKRMVFWTMTDGGGGYSLYVMQKEVSGTTYSTADLQGTWQMHGLVSPDHGPTNTTGWAGWIHGTTTYDANGNGTGSAVGSDGGNRSKSGSMTISATGVTTVNGTNTYGFMSADKRTVVWTMTDGGGGYSLYLMQKEASGTTYSPADLQGTWQMQGLVSPDDALSGGVGWAGWMHGTMTYDASGNGTGSAVASDGTTRSRSGSMSISSGGVISVTGTDTYGFMSADKRTVVWIITDGGGGYSLYVMQKDLTPYQDAGVQVQFVTENNGWATIYRFAKPEVKMFRTTDGGSTWTMLPSLGLEGCIFYFVDVNTGWRLTLSPVPPYKIMKTTNGGLSWFEQYSFNSTTDDSSGFNALQFTDMNTGWVVGDHGKILKTTDGGNNWTSVTNTGISDDAKSKCVFFLNANTGWIGTNLSTTGSSAGPQRVILHTTDGGSTWTSQYPSLQTSGTNTAAVFSIFFTNSKEGWFTADYIIGHTTTGGATGVAEQHVSISSFTPASGPVGTRVTINGTNFSTSPANNIVFFGAVRATVTLATSTSLTVTVPAGATYQPITVTVAGLTGYSSQPFIVTFPTIASITSTSFASKVDFATGTYPFGVAIGDLDGDGKPDLVISNSNNMIGTTVSVFRNTSSSDSITSGTFASKLDFTTGLSPRGVAIGDIDGDGKLDLVVGDYQSNSVSVLRNTSASGAIAAGSFGAKVDFATGPAPDYVAIADIDGDGKPDLITANISGNNVSVLRNTSATGSITSGSFAANVDFATGTIPYAVAVGDIDGDGKPDLVVANYGSNTVSVLRNTSTFGIVSFAEKVDLATGTNPYSVAIGDFDGDGKPDLVIVNENSNTVSVMRNTITSGCVTFAAKVDFTTGTTPTNAALGDIDGDGKLDMVVSNGMSNTVSVLRNTSSSGSIISGSFAAKVDFATGANPLGVAICDFDGDGKPDLVVGNFAGNTVSVLRNTVAASMAPPTITSFAPSSGPLGTAVTIRGTNFSSTSSNNVVFFGATKATLTGASTSQLTVTVPAGATYQPITVTVGGLTAYSSQPFIVTFPTVASITFGSFASKVEIAAGPGPMRTAVADLDGDGKADLVVANGGSNTVSVFRNTSSYGSIASGSFAAKVDLGTGTLPVVIAIGDLDGDGKPDLVVSNRNSNTVSVFRNISTAGSISFAARVDLTTGVQPYCVAIGDLDGDGRPDLVVGNINGSVSVFRNTGSIGSITSDSFMAKVDFATGANPDGVAIGDVDGDGKPDVVVASCDNNILSVLRNTSVSGVISFAARADFRTGTEPHGVAIGDLDGDGKPDLVVGNYKSSTVSVLRNTSSPGSITFAANVELSALAPLSVAISDIDGDGKPDLVVSNTGGDAITVFRNTSSTGSITSSSFAANIDFGSGVTPYYIETGDIDGDGKPDLLSANLTSNTVSVLQNLIQPPHTQLTIASIGPPTAFKGTDFSIEIRVGDSARVANVFGLGFDLLFTNKSYIDFVSADISSSFLGTDLIYLVTPDDANGKISVGLSRKSPLSGVSGGGTLIRLKFHVTSTAINNGTVTFSFANVSANDQNGTSIALSPISRAITIKSLVVWPGDADNNGWVSQVDILPLGLYWGSTGPARSTASLQWIAQTAIAWTPQAATYADANGDGVVNQADVLAVGLNWGKLQAVDPGMPLIPPKLVSVLGTPVLRATCPASVRGKTVFNVAITLGDTINPVSGLFGISFVLDFAGWKGIVRPMEVTQGTFLGSDVIFFPQIDTTDGLVAVGMTRKSGADGVAGFGQLADIKFQVVNSTSSSSLIFTTKDITANDAGGNPVAIQPSSTSILVSVSDVNTVPTGYRLEQNYPNPFNPTTHIVFDLPKDGRVSLIVYNVLGQTVAQLLDGTLSAGTYNYNFAADRLSAGIYYYVLVADEFRATKKMVLLK